MTIGGIFSADIGTTCGWAYAVPNDTPIWGHRNFADVEPGPGGVFCAFGDWLEKRFAETSPAYFVREELWVSRGRGNNILTVRRLFGMDAIALRIARQRGIKIREWPIQTVARFHGTFGLKSAQKKRVTRQNMIQRYGFLGATEDEADALALWLYAEAILEPRSRRCVGPLFTPTREIVDSRTNSK